MMNTWIIGIIGQERRFNKYLAVLLLFLVCSCGTTSISNRKTQYYYDKEMKTRVYEQVDEPPLYNDEVWQIGLSKEFNKHFQYKFQEGESIITKIVVELILDKNGVIVYSRLLQNEETAFGKEALKVLHDCDKWSPGRVNGKEVCTKLLWQVVY